MIRSLIDFALKNRILVVALGVLLLIWGIISFRNLPVEAYPDVADKYVWVITQWPGRAAEEVEQQITIPIETQLNGVGHLTHLRSTSLAGLSFITVLFDDESDNLQNRQQVLEKLTLVNLPPGLNPQIGPDFSPAGQIYFYTLQSTNPQYDVMDLKALQDWVVYKHLMSVPNVAAVSIFGGQTREYQVQIDPDKLVSYGLTMAQVEQALTNNNLNGGGSFIEKGQQAYNVRAVGLMQNTDDIGATVLTAGGEHRGTNVVGVLHQPYSADVISLLTFLNEAAAAVEVVVGKRLLDLRHGQAIRHQLVRIDLYLVLASLPAED